MTDQERTQLIVEIEDALDVETEDGQQQLLAEFPGVDKEDLANFFDDSGVSAMQQTLIVILLIILLSLLASSFLPEQLALNSKKEVNDKQEM